MICCVPGAIIEMTARISRNSISWICTALVLAVLSGCATHPTVSKRLTTPESSKEWIEIRKETEDIQQKVWTRSLSIPDAVSYINSRHRTWVEEYLSNKRYASRTNATSELVAIATLINAPYYGANMLTKDYTRPYKLSAAESNALSTLDSLLTKIEDARTSDLQSRRANSAGGSVYADTPAGRQRASQEHLAQVRRQKQLEALYFQSHIDTYAENLAVCGKQPRVKEGTGYPSAFDMCVALASDLERARAFSERTIETARNDRGLIGLISQQIMLTLGKQAAVIRSFSKVDKCNPAALATGSAAYECAYLMDIEYLDNARFQNFRKGLENLVDGGTTRRASFSLSNGEWKSGPTAADLRAIADMERNAMERNRQRRAQMEQDLDNCMATVTTVNQYVGCQRMHTVP